MKPGTIVRVANRGEATVVYHGLDGYGIVWGIQDIDTVDLPAPQAMLRNPYPGAEYECVGEEYEHVVEPVDVSLKIAQRHLQQAIRSAVYFELRKCADIAGEYSCKNGIGDDGVRQCCPRCGAQTLSPHECYPPESELYGGAPVEVRLEERQQITAFIERRFAPNREELKETK